MNDMEDLNSNNLGHHWYSIETDIMFHFSFPNCGNLNFEKMFCSGGYNFKMDWETVLFAPFLLEKHADTSHRIEPWWTNLQKSKKHCMVVKKCFGTRLVKCFQYLNARKWLIEPLKIQYRFSNQKSTIGGPRSFVL